MPHVTAVPADEIHEKYLQKAISEINELGDEIAQKPADSRIPLRCAARAERSQQHVQPGQRARRGGACVAIAQDFPV